jgi:hypothetical protein
MFRTSKCFTTTSLHCGAVTTPYHFLLRWALPLLIKSIDDACTRIQRCKCLAFFVYSRVTEFSHSKTDALVYANVHSTKERPLEANAIKSSYRLSRGRVDVPPSISGTREGGCICRNATKTQRSPRSRQGGLLMQAIAPAQDRTSYLNGSLGLYFGPANDVMRLHESSE